MTKKKRELIEILLGNVKPEDWPENAVYAAQDKETLAWGKRVLMFYSDREVPYVNTGCKYFFGKKVGSEIKLPEICKHWSKTIVHRDEFMKRWNERNTHVEVKTPQQLALEKFGTDWHDNEGVQPVDDDVLIDTKYKCGEVDLGVLSHQICMLIPYTHAGTDSYQVESWRIHSDEKESQAEIATNQLACDDGHMASESVSKSPLSTQIGGNHYTKLTIQPMRYSMANGLDALQHAVIKYVTRFRDKNGIEDLEKAKHCIDMLIEFEKEQK